MKTTKCYMGEHCLHFGELDLAVETRKINGTYRPARIVWESDWKKLMKLVRDVADHPSCGRRCERGEMVFCGVCLSCRARKLLETKP